MSEPADLLSSASPGGALIPAAMGTGRFSHAELARLVDQAASFHLLAVPGPDRAQTLHRFDLELEPPSAAHGVRGANTVGESAGRLDLRWSVIPWSWAARPDRQPPAERLDASRSQRITLQEAIFTFANGDGFRSFGTGRTFPVMAGGRARLTVAAVGNLVEGLGRLRGRQGNFTLCGELTADHQIEGHIMVRIVDPDGSLRTGAAPAPAAPPPNPTPDVTYLTWIAQKGESADQENYFSFSQDGQVRGVNIPVALHPVQTGIASLADGLRVRHLTVGPEVIGLEIGFGRETQPRTSISGTGLNPYQFEGVSEYTFYDRDGRTSVGAFKANFLEGRSFEMELPGAPGQSSLRFSYYGVITGGTGCFRGVQGMLYGTAGSVFNPPPSDHVISNLYVARLHDPDGRFRAGGPGGR
jgi:hypothetical protein